MLQINLTPAINELKKIKAKKILLQIPEGLKVKVNEIILELEKNGFEIVTSLDPCYGACDLKVKEAKQLFCDAILHLGHNQFVKEKTVLPVIYLPLSYKLENFEKIINQLTSELIKKKIKKIGFVTTIQYINYIPKIKTKLFEEKIKMITQKGERVIHGQVLGCNYSAVPNIENIIYFGDGLFHPLGIHFASQKEVIVVNPINEKIYSLDKEKDKFLRQRILMIEKTKTASSFAILVTTKIGQERLKLAKKIKKQLNENGKDAEIFVMDFISQDKLLGIKTDAYISTICPRLAIDDFSSYKKPIINACEVDYLLGKDYNNYKLDLWY